jgi:hypothetical protein
VSERNGQRTRRDDGWLVTFWRLLVPLLAVGIAAYAVLSVEDKVDQQAVDAEVAKAEARTATRVADAQKEGRRVAVRITCGALLGVEDAGRLALTDRLPGTEKYRRPSTRAERRVRQVYARAYNRVISNRIREEAGLTAVGIVRKDGSIDCEALGKASGVPPSP